MSRGPGRWQRLILRELERRDVFYLIDLLPQEHTMTDYKALHRAFVRLTDGGKIGYWRFLCGQAKIVVCRPGSAQPDRRKLDKCRQGSIMESYQHITGEAKVIAHD